MTFRVRSCFFFGGWGELGQPTGPELFQENDRATALVVAAMLDDFLIRTLKYVVHLDKKTEETMFRDAGVVGNFSSRIHLGFMIGLYGGDPKFDLLQLAKIRNKFAHEYGHVSFEREDIKNLILSLKTPEKYYSYQDEDWLENHTSGQRLIPIHDLSDLNTPRPRLLIAFQALSWIIYDGVLQHPRMPPPSH